MHTQITGGDGTDLHRAVKSAWLHRGWSPTWHCRNRSFSALVPDEAGDSVGKDPELDRWDFHLELSRSARLDRAWSLNTDF